MGGLGKPRHGGPLGSDEILVLAMTPGDNVGIGIDPAAAKLHVVDEDSANSTTTDVLYLDHRIAAGATAPAAGIGVGIVLRAEDASRAVQTVANVRAVLSTVTAGAEVGALRIGLVSAGALPAEGAEHYNLAPGTLTIRGTAFAQLALESTARAAAMYVDNPTGILIVQPNTAAAGVQFGATAYLTMNSNTLTWTQAAVATDTPAGLKAIFGAHTALTASTEVIDVDFSSMTRTVQLATGALAAQRAVRFGQPTYGFVGASTITDAATVYIAGAPVAGANATLTRTYPLWIDAGTMRYDDAVALGGGAAPTVGTIGGSGPTVAAQNEWLRINVGGNVRFLPLWA